MKKLNLNKNIFSEEELLLIEKEFKKSCLKNLVSCFLIPFFVLFIVTFGFLFTNEELWKSNITFLFFGVFYFLTVILCVFKYLSHKENCENLLNACFHEFGHAFNDEIEVERTSLKEILIASSLNKEMAYSGAAGFYSPGFSVKNLPEKINKEKLLDMFLGGLAAERCFISEKESFNSNAFKGDLELIKLNFKNKKMKKIWRRLGLIEKKFKNKKDVFLKASIVLLKERRMNEHQINLLKS